MNTHVVLRKLPGPNGEILPGTEVDASEWRNAPLLVKQRYLKPLDAVGDPDGQSLPAATLAQQVIAIVKQNILDGGELSEFVTPRHHNVPIQETATPRARKSSQS